jgi:hypothetical protein
MEMTTEQYSRETVTHHAWRVHADTNSSFTTVDIETKLLPPQVFLVSAASKTKVASATDLVYMQLDGLLI